MYSISLFIILKFWGLLVFMFSSFVISLGLFSELELKLILLFEDILLIVEL